MKSRYVRSKCFDIENIVDVVSVRVYNCLEVNVVSKAGSPMYRINLDLSGTYYSSLRCN